MATFTANFKALNLEVVILGGVGCLESQALHSLPLLRGEKCFKFVFCELKNIFYVYGCYICIYVWTPCVCLVPKDPEEGTGSPGDWGYGWFLSHVGAGEGTWVP